MVEYKVALVSSPMPGEAVRLLIELVEDGRVQGWRPSGGVSITSHNNEIFAAQAVTREVPRPLQLVAFPPPLPPALPPPHRSV